LFQPGRITDVVTISVEALHGPRCKRPFRHDGRGETISPQLFGDAAADPPGASGHGSGSLWGVLSYRFFPGSFSSALLSRSW
jgi:hypothetical protein